MRLRAFLPALALAACSIPVSRARLDSTSPASDRELAAQARVAASSCSAGWRFLFPGLGHLCQGDRATGGALMVAGAVELGTAIVAADALDDGDDPRVALPLLLFQDTYVYGIIEPTLEQHRAAHLTYTPQDTLPELLAAPFNVEVLRRPSVWGALLATAAAAGVAIALEGTALGADRNVLGETMSPWAAWPAAAGIYGVTFTHVGVAEETLFRGWIQSSLARGCGETCGWALGSAIFGLAHVPNAFALETSEERRDYLVIAIPVITAVGSYLGLTYRWNDYSLAPPVALHFWYDFLVGVADFAANPDDSILGARLTLPW